RRADADVFAHGRRQGLEPLSVGRTPGAERHEAQDQPPAHPCPPPRPTCSHGPLSPVHRKQQAVWATVSKTPARTEPPNTAISRAFGARDVRLGRSTERRSRRWATNDEADACSRSPPSGLASLANAASRSVPRSRSITDSSQESSR